MNGGAIVRSALGSTASLGDLYDARTDDFCGIPIFKKTIPDGAIKLADSHFSDILLVHSDDFSEKFSKLDVSAELQVSVLAGLFRLEGSGRYLNDKKTSARTVKSSLIYNIKTKQESLNIYHEELKDAFAIDAIESGMATHVVAGISWGANSIVSCQYENRENRDNTEVSGSLSAHLKKMSLSISGRAAVDFNEGDTTTGLKFDVRMFGDILSTNEELPTTFEGALNLMKKLPTLVASSNEGKGKPLSYRLLPISLLKSYLNISVQADITLKQIEEASLVRVVQLFDEMSKSQQKLHDFCQDAIQFKYCVQSEDFKKICQLRDEMSILETSFRSQLSTFLTGIRAGSYDVSKLEQLMEKIQSSSVSSQNVSSTLASWGDIVERINLARAMSQAGAKFIGFGESLEEELFKDFNSNLVVLYFSKSSKVERERWGGNRQLFIEEIKKGNDGYKFFVVDCDIHPNSGSLNGSSCVKVMRAGRVLVDDMLAKHKETGTTSFAMAVSGATRIIYKPSKLAPFSTVCSGNRCNPTEVHDWVCERCKQKLEYGFDEHVYCTCGKTSAMGLEFKCNDPEHGPSFLQHDHEFLSQILTTIRSFKEINMLVVGDNAEEKKMWIKIFASCLKYEKFENIEIDRLFQKQIINWNVDGNDETNQAVEVYMITVGTLSIRLVCTPNITVPQDQRAYAFQNQMNAISHLEQIHGICLMLNLNSPIADNIFKMQLEQLMVSFGGNVYQNVVFCVPVTDSGVHCSLDEMMLSLRRLVLENNVSKLQVSHRTLYRYDNDVQYFYYSAESASQPTTLQERRWKGNVSEAKRMLDSIKQMQPLVINSRLTPESIGECVEIMTKCLLNALLIVVQKSRKLEHDNNALYQTKTNFERDISRGGMKGLKANYYWAPLAPILAELINNNCSSIEQCKEELELIQRELVRFGCFINPKSNESLHDKIGLEFHRIINDKNDVNLLTSLNQMKQTYIDRMKARYGESPDGSQENGPVSFSDLVKIFSDFKHLKESGATFMEAIDEIAQAFPTICF